MTEINNYNIVRTGTPHEMIERAHTPKNDSYGAKQDGYPIPLKKYNSEQYADQNPLNLNFKKK